MRPTFGSLFAGLGGWDKGLERAGMRCLWQVEIEPFCRAILKKHWPRVERHSDIHDVGARNLQPVDVICASSPCQDISGAGEKTGIGGPKSRVWSQAVRVVEELRPRVFAAEQVAVVVRRGLNVMLRDLASIGYDAEWDCVTACAFGAPHMRRRLLLVAYANDQGQPPRPLHAEASWLRSDAEHLRDWWSPRPGTVRMADGIPNGMDRLIALGNAIMPCKAEWVGRRILEKHFAITEAA